MAAKSNRIFGLDVIRATAILLVLFSHSSILLFPQSESYIVFIIQFFGTIGVDIFFVLSGYLIGSILVKQLETVGFSIRTVFHFWLRRWFRTLPNYYLILLVNIVLFWYLYGTLPPEISLYTVFLQNFSSAQPNFFTESWSLSIEEFAYIIGPLMLLSISLFKKQSLNKKIFISTTLFIIGLFTLSRIWFHFENTYNELQWSNSLRKVVIYRIDSIYYGFIGAYISFYFKEYWFRIRWFAFSFGVIIFTCIHLYLVINGVQPTTDSIFFNVLYLPIISSSILLLFPVFSNWSNGSMMKEIITNISKWSYALYLVNYSIVLLSIQYFIDISILGITKKVLVLALFWFTSFALAYLLYKYFEKPILDFREKPRFKNWTRLSS